MFFQDLIRQLARELGLPALLPDADGICAIRFDGLSFCLRDLGRQVVLVSCWVGRLDPRDRCTQERLLAGNLMPEQVGVAILGMDASGDVYLSGHLDCAQLTFPTFLVRLEQVVDAAAYWSGCFGASRPVLAVH
ncbi:type III secretion system chaperone [Ramlibacter sp. AW1]|uniref:Type III secretion system chaperone n=1 Tax=Ramlibacter aurantiacus TaxID=2801330 RepID=A0A937D606_9BURK|nr:type III secretion system chaperone [Ramlibacter aurantiacus]MBL0423245.1 type III secretion system chaperone [Ramlibacter aurantiacus]